MPTTAQEELERTLSLLRIEKEDDLAQYNTYIKQSPLHERREKGVCWYPVQIKETGYGLGDYPYVIVERPTQRDREHQFNGGKAASLFNNLPGGEEEEAHGTINYVSGNTMKIIFNGNDLPEWISDGKIGVNLLFDERSYREMEDAIKKVIKAEGNRLADLREIILGTKAPAKEEDDYHVKIPSLNDSQNDAVNEILRARDIAVVHGPPGTGKTTTIVQAIKIMAQTEKRILVCAPSNAAADLLTEKIANEGLKVVRIGNLSRIDDNILAHTLEGMIAQHPLHKEVKKLKKQADEFRRMGSKYKRKYGKDEREQRRLLMYEAKQLALDAVKMENYVVADILAEADAITCTLVGSINRYLEDRSFKTVIIDEAAQALEPANWIPIMKAQRVVLAGDPFQLPPTVKSNRAAKEGLGVTLMEKCLKRLPENSLLKVQYRMNDIIMGFSNKEFYDGALVAHESVRNAVLGISDSHPLTFIDTAGCSFDEKMDGESRSLYNPGEADILRKHLTLLVAELEISAEEATIGVISPYREQVLYLREIVNNDPELSGLRQIDVNTIDSFQGQERDIIYISLVRSNEKSEIGFLADHRRMNVAMTRARKKLVVIGDSATLGNHAFYLDFLQFAEEKGEYLSAWTFMG